MGEIVHIRDVDWNSSIVSLPGAEKWSTIDRHIISNGFVADLCGQQMMFLDTMNSWGSISSKPVALRVSQLLGNESASVNYTKSYEPYYGKISKACNTNSISYLPVSVCIGTKRLGVEADVTSRTLAFSVLPPFQLKRRPNIKPFVYSLCYQPAEHIELPVSYTFPGKGKIMNFLSPLFPDARSMFTYMWVIGNAIRDPVGRPRCLMMCGPGGSGKSTALRMATAALYGCTNLIPDNILTRDYEGLSDRIAETVVKSRMVTCYELDLDNKNINMSLFKNITGGDYVKVDQFMSKAVCSFMIATNGLPDHRRQPEFSSDAISRRMICLKMDVDTANATFEPDPADPVDKVDFLSACLYVRMLYPNAPLSPDTILLSLCLSQYFEALKYVKEDVRVAVSAVKGREVVAILSGLLGMSTDRITDRCRLMSTSSVEYTPLGYIISGLHPLSRR